MHKTLGFKWLIQASCPAKNFVSVDRNVPRNPLLHIALAVTSNLKDNNVKIFERIIRAVFKPLVGKLIRL